MTEIKPSRSSLHAKGPHRGNYGDPATVSIEKIVGSRWQIATVLCRDGAERRFMQDGRTTQSYMISPPATPAADDRAEKYLHSTERQRRRIMEATGGRAPSK
jgi:hypothetical protein